MKHFIRLIRLPNLLIMAITMVLIRYCIIRPIFSQYYIDLEFSNILFACLVFSVLLIAVAGYMINDYFDIKTDLINRPDQVIIGKYIKASVVYRSYFILNAIAFCLSSYISFKIGVISMMLIFVLVMGILWFYSNTYKHQLLIGNIIVALLVASLPMLVALFEMPLVHAKYLNHIQAYLILLKIVMGWCGAYAVFAFILNLIREIIKDMEDFEGDMAYGRNTLPIAFGPKITKIVIVTLLSMTIVLIELAFLWLLEPDKLDMITFLYFHFLLIIPLIIAIILILMANQKKQYTILSFIIKLVMVFGILYAFIVKFKMSGQIG
jgi:4-hydroxybenzoate polyprenyltransferase